MKLCSFGLEQLSPAEDRAHPTIGMLLSIFLAGSQELAEITLNLQSQAERSS